MFHMYCALTMHQALYQALFLHYLISSSQQLYKSGTVAEAGKSFAQCYISAKQ